MASSSFYPSVLTGETGVSVLKGGQTRVQHFFQKRFRHAPQIFHAVSCFTFGLDARPAPKPSYSNKVPWREPNKMGLLVQVTSVTPHGVTFQLQDLSFGDTVNWETCISFQACAFHPGKEIVVPEPTPPPPTTTPPDTTPFEEDFE